MTAVSKNVYFDVIDNIVDKYNKTCRKYNNTYLNSVKPKSIDVKSNSYVEYNLDSSAKDAKFKIDDHVRISKYKNIFAKVYRPNWSEEVFLLVKLRILYHGHMLLLILTVKILLKLFMKKKLEKKKNQEEFKIKNVIKKKGNKLYVKWKVYGNSSNSWIYKKSIV